MEIVKVLSLLSYFDCQDLGKRFISRDFFYRNNKQIHIHLFCLYRCKMIVVLIFLLALFLFFI